MVCATKMEGNNHAVFYVNVVLPTIVPRSEIEPTSVAFWAGMLDH